MNRYKKLLPIFILIGLILGVVLGRICALNPSVGTAVIPVVSWMGISFMNLLKVLIIPLVFSSLVVGIMNIGGGRNLGRLGAKTMGLYMLTSLIATVIGLILVNNIKPGVGASLNSEAATLSFAENGKSISSILDNLIPSNIVQSMANGDMLHLILFAILFGVFASQINDKGREFINNLFTSLFEIMMLMTGWVITLAPFGIFGIVTREVAKHADISGIVSSLGLFVLTVTLGILIHFFIVLPILVKTLGRSNPFKHLKNMSTALLTAFTTASSSATLPLTMEAVENRSGVSNRISSFCLPLGATINMDGTALFECVAAIFIAQAYGIELSLGAQITIVATALLTSIGCAGIPMASFVMLVVILSAVGLPLEGLGVILAVDFILDMMRTTTNIWSDSCVAVIVARSEGETLKV